MKERNGLVSRVPVRRLLQTWSDLAIISLDDRHILPPGFLSAPPAPH